MTTVSARHALPHQLESCVRRCDGTTTDRIAAIGARIGCHVIILDEDLSIRTCTPGTPSVVTDDLKRAIASAGQPPEVQRRANLAGLLPGQPNSELAVARIDLVDGDVALVALIESELGQLPLDPDSLQVTFASIAVELIRSEALAEGHARRIDALFHMLLCDGQLPEATVQRRASELGVVFADRNAVIALASADDNDGRPGARLSVRQRLQESIETASGAPAAVFEHQGTLCALLTLRDLVTGGELRRIADRVAREVAGLDAVSGYWIAYAGPHPHLSGVRVAIDECLQTLRVMRVTAPIGVPTGFDELGIWTILHSADQRHMRRFKDQILGPLVEHDKRRNSYLLDTLRALVRANFQSREASGMLDVHDNTVRYRMSVMAKLTGLDLTAYGDQVKADIALRINDQLRIDGGFALRAAARSA